MSGRRVLVTGASGFVGSAVARKLHADGLQVRAVGGRREIAGFPDGVERLSSIILGAQTDWTAALDACDAVVHVAARVHVMKVSNADDEALFHRINVDGTLHLARQAAACGVRRFVFISSVKVNGEGTVPGRPYLETDAPAPQDPYGVSKDLAERGLREIARETGLQVAIVRPTLMYGPGVRANFLSMMRWVQRGVPLPLASIDNRRSLLGLGNLVDLLAICVRHPAAADETFLAADGEDVSTPDLLRRVGRSIGRSARLFPMPVSVLMGVGGLVGMRPAMSRLCGSLQVDISKARSLLGWSPPFSLDAGLANTAAHFLRTDLRQ